MAQVSKAYADLITHTRSSAGSRFNTQGKFEMVAANQPRFDYDPVTLQLRGLLIEEQRTNLLTYSSDFSQAAWGKSDTTVSTDGTLAPDGSQMQLLTQGSAGTGYVNRGGSAIVSAGAVTASKYMRRGNHDWVRLTVANNPGGTNAGHAWFNLATGTKGQTLLTGTATGVTSNIIHVGGGLYRCEVSAVLSDTTANIVSIGVTGDGVSTRVSGGYRYCWLAQLEQGAFASSPIPTTDSQVTRAADLASVNALSPWINATAGTMFVEWSVIGTTYNAPVWVLQGGGTNLIRQRSDQAKPLFDIFVAGAQQASIAVGAPVVSGVVRKAAGAWATDNVQAAVDGMLGTEDVTSQIPVVSQLAMGRASVTSAYFNGHIRRIRYYPRRLSNAELQALTA